MLSGVGRQPIPSCQSLRKIWGFWFVLEGTLIVVIVWLLTFDCLFFFFLIWCFLTFIFIYLCIWLCCVLVEVCGVFSCDMQDLSCGMWDLVPWPGTERYIGSADLATAPAGKSWALTVCFSFVIPLLFVISSSTECTALMSRKVSTSFTGNVRKTVRNCLSHQAQWDGSSLCLPFLHTSEKVISESAHTLSPENAFLVVSHDEAPTGFSC